MKKDAGYVGEKKDEYVKTQDYADDSCTEPKVDYTKKDTVYAKDQ